jgi:predicted nucleotidyltransferase
MLERSKCFLALWWSMDLWCPHEELTERETLIDGQGFTIRAAALEDIIAAKERANRPKHREALSELRALRDTP